MVKHRFDIRRDSTAFSMLKCGIYPAPFHSTALKEFKGQSFPKIRSDRCASPAPFRRREHTRARTWIFRRHAAGVFSQLVPLMPLTIDDSPPPLFPVTPASRSWKILSGHGRLPTKDPAFHTHVIILFTQYRFSSPPHSHIVEEEIRVAIRLGTVYPTPTHCSRDHRQRETSTESRRKPRDFLV